MLRKLAVALVATSVVAAPVLAQTGSTGTQTPAKPAIAAPATPSKTVAPADQAKQTDSAKPTDSVKQTKKKSRHRGKQVRHGVRGKVANSHNAKVAVAHKGSPNGAGAIR